MGFDTIEINLVPKLKLEHFCGVFLPNFSLLNSNIIAKENKNILMGFDTIEINLVFHYFPLSIILQQLMQNPACFYRNCHIPPKPRCSVTA